mgnify:FL=1
MIMKKGLVFLLGAITGAVLTFVFFVVLGVAVNGSSRSSDSVDYFDEVGQVMPVQEYKVIQVLPDGNALAMERSNEEYDWYHGPVVLLVGGEEAHYYDEQVVKRTKGGHFRQVGTYRYTARDGSVKTVPAVALR